MGIVYGTHKENAILLRHYQNLWANLSLEEAKKIKVQINRNQRALHKQYIDNKPSGEFDLTDRSPLDEQYTIEQHRKVLYIQKLAIKRILTKKHNIR